MAKNRNEETTDDTVTRVVKLGDHMIDIVKAEVVEVLIDYSNRNRLWINVDGVCRLRIGSTDTLVLNDPHDQSKAHIRRRGE